MFNATNIPAVQEIQQPAILLTRPTLAPRVSRPIVRLPQRGCSPLRSIFGQLSEVRRRCLDRWCAPLAQRIQRPTPEARRDDDRPACPLRQNGGGPSPRGADGGHRTTRGGHSPIQWRNTAPTVGMKLFNIVHFHRSRLRRLIEPTGALGSIMISGAQIRAARGLLCWTRQELARRAVVSDATVYGLQTARGSAANPSTLAAVQATLEAGHRFLDGPAPGLRLHP